MRRKFHTTLKFCALAIVLTMITGCGNPYLMQLRDEFGWTEAKMLQDGWLKSYPVAQPPVYCYKTLADTDCFPSQKLEHKDRQISSSYEREF